MITIELNEQSAEDVKLFLRLKREWGFKDEDLQKMYDAEQKKRDSLADSQGEFFRHYFAHHKKYGKER